MERKKTDDRAQQDRGVQHDIQRQIAIGQRKGEKKTKNKKLAKPEITMVQVAAEERKGGGISGSTGEKKKVAANQNYSSQNI